MSEHIGGINAVEALLRERPGDCLKLLALDARQDRRLQALLAEAQAADVRVILTDKRTLDGLVRGVHQGVVAEIRPWQAPDEADLYAAVEADAQCLLLVLDGVTDPHNLGACIRTAEAAGAVGILIPKDRSVQVNTTVRKVSSGAAERLPVYPVTNLARTLQKLRDQGVWITGLAGEATQDIWAQDLKGRCALVMGSEGDGMRRLTREHCDHLVRIPMAGQIESLNVSVAAGIALFEARRQRLLIKS